MSRRYDFQDLKYLMSRLRHSEDGCPWDIKQTYRSIVPHTLEEVYEVIDTIEREDYEHLSEELGDLLFQVVFYAEIASNEERFDLDDVVHGIVSKLVYRHPHVFPEGTLESRVIKTGYSTEPVNAPDNLNSHAITIDGVAGQWELLKAAEKSAKGASKRVLGDVPLSLPGLIRSKKLQSKAAKVGFDWPSINEVLAKVHEELAELEEAIVDDNADEIENELGDLLFVLANVARHRGIDPEQAIRRTNKKFENRFDYVEDQVLASKKQWNEYDLNSLDAFWDEAKAKEKKS